MITLSTLVGNRLIFPIIETGQEFVSHEDKDIGHQQKCIRTGGLSKSVQLLETGLNLSPVQKILMRTV